MSISSQTSHAAPLDLIRALRRAGRAAQARALGAQLAASENPGCHPGQLGVDLSYLALYSEAERFLMLGLADASLSLANRYSLTDELCGVRAILGKYSEAHEGYRTIRGRAYAEAFRHLILGDHPLWRSLLPDKLLDMDEPVSGKRILILGEGGFGDFVMFSRYVEALLREGAREVVLEHVPGWEGVFRQCERVSLFLPTEERRDLEAARSDRATFGFSLYARYQRSPDFPFQDASARIAIDPGKVLSDAARALLHEAPAGLKVGLIWRSASGVRHAPYRSMPLNALQPILSNGKCRFHSLQVGALSDEERSLLNQYEVTDLAPHLADFGDTARVLEALDLLVTIDTGAAHLAGALNRPAWVLLPQACDPRWLDCQRCTPWYPSMRLYRQSELGEWAPPLADLAADLSSLSAS
ncbi:tetratricopeptide repeat protein [Caballeronia hypogeia]|uniref:Tetratricopeptide repeat protein n=1 Tax=Caballeronia hypogeia TaxID=1777140 RepID=A0A158B7H3_9BURK|nr:glycosyltransferase family 9 protein [Caballeronia hypogeia]SAK65860.1 tetratricopeptide repeat protein [Caballeronia hypogeia]